MISPLAFDMLTFLGCQSMGKESTVSWPTLHHINIAVWFIVGSSVDIDVFLIHAPTKGISPMSVISTNAIPVHQVSMKGEDRGHLW